MINTDGQLFLFDGNDSQNNGKNSSNNEPNQGENVQFPVEIEPNESGNDGCYFIINPSNPLFELKESISVNLLEDSRTKAFIDKLDREHIYAEIIELTPVIDFEAAANPHLEKIRVQLELLRKELSPDKEKIARLEQDLKKRKHPDSALILNELSKAILYAVNEAGYFLSRKPDGSLWFFDGYWKPIDIPLFESMIAAAAVKASVREETAYDPEFIKGVYDRIRIRIEPFGKRIDVAGVNCLNQSVFILPDGNIVAEPHKYNDYFEYILDYPYDPAAKPIEFQQFLNEILPNKTAQKVLQLFLGWVFIPHSVLNLRKVLFLYGSGANGKSSLMNIILNVLGKNNVLSESLENLTNSTNYYVGNLAGKLINFCDENSGYLSPSKLKILACGEPITARSPFGKPYSIENYAKLVFAINALPRSSEQTAAFYDRFVIIPFERVFKGKTENKDRTKYILDNEKPAVLNWIIEGTVELLRVKRLPDLEESNELVREYELQTDAIRWFADSIIESQTGVTPLSEIWRRYALFCQFNGVTREKQGDSRKLSNGLRQLGYKADRRKTGMVFYLTLKPELDA